MRTSVHIPDDLLRRAKKKALAEGRTLTSLIEEGLRTVLSAKPKQAVLRRVELPVSSAKGGGLLPGFDPEKLATQVQELEDMDYVARLRDGFK
jgi:hypothetical protein